MKTIKLSVLCFSATLLLSYSETKAQVYADNQTNGVNGLCLGCT